MIFSAGNHDKPVNNVEMFQEAKKLLSLAHAPSPGHLLSLDRVTPIDTRWLQGFQVPIMPEAPVRSLRKYLHRMSLSRSRTGRPGWAAAQCSLAS